MTTWRNVAGGRAGELIANFAQGSVGRSYVERSGSGKDNIDYL